VCVELHRSLDLAGIPHAFGRRRSPSPTAPSTRAARGDIDCNLFVPASSPGGAPRCAPGGVERTDDTVPAIERDGQIRLWWAGTPVDLFFDYAHPSTRPRHDVDASCPSPASSARARLHRPGALQGAVRPLEGLGDIEAVVVARTLDVQEVRAALVALLGADDGRVARFDRLVDTAPPNP
jgi:hypothetical protein